MAEPVQIGEAATSAMQEIGRVSVCLCLAAAIPSIGFGQSKDVGGLLTGPPVLDVPFSADATTTVQQMRADSTRIERSATARYYRDRAGRVRVEQMIEGSEADPATRGRVRITVHPDVASKWVYTLDQASRTATKFSRTMAALTVGGGNTFVVPLGGIRFLVFHQGPGLQARFGLGSDAIEEESLGSRRIAGIEATGRRITTTIPAGHQFGNERPMQIVDEQWESPDLKMVIYSRHSDPLTGVVEYRLANIRPTEPPSDLFVVPADYTIGVSPGDDSGIYLDFAEAPHGAKGPWWTRR